MTRNRATQPVSRVMTGRESPGAFGRDSIRNLIRFALVAPALQETPARRSRGRLLAVLILTGGFMLVEVAGAVFTGSLALAADAGHMLTDVGGLALALFAVWIAARPPTPAKTFGYYRAEILAALVNALVLLVVAGAVLVEAYPRLRAPPGVLGAPMRRPAAAG